MATGDIKGNIAQLERALRHLKYPAAVDEVGLMLGDPCASLPVLNFVLLKYSRHVAAHILSVGVELQAKTDDGFVRGAFRLCRDHLGIRTVLTPAQFLEQGYAERKVLLLCDVVKVARELHAAGAKQERARVQAAFRQSPAKLQQLAGSPSPKVERCGLVTTSRLHKLPDTTATDAGQSIFAPLGAVEKMFSSKVAASPSPLKATQQQRFAGFNSPAGASAAAAGEAWACDTSPSHDQLVAAGLMPLSSWRAAAAASPAAAAAGAAGGPAASSRADVAVQSAAAGAQRQRQQQQQQQQSPVLSPPASRSQPEQEVELQQESQWMRAAAGVSPAQQSPAVALPQQQVWVPLQPPQQAEQPQEQGADWEVEQEQWAPAGPPQQQKPQQPSARTCLWPKKQQVQQQEQLQEPEQQQQQPDRRQQVAMAARLPTQPVPQHEPSRRLPPPPLQQQRHPRQQHHAGMQPLQQQPERLVSQRQQQDEQQQPHAQHELLKQQQEQQQLLLEQQEQQQHLLLQQQEEAQQEQEAILMFQGEQQVALSAAQQAIEQLQQALARAESQMQEHRSAGRRFEESVCARVTVLEGRIKLLEAQVASRCCPVCHAREQQAEEVAAELRAERQAAAAAATAGGSGVGASSAGSAHKSRQREPWPQPSPLKSPPAPVAAAPPGSTSKPGSINWRAAASAAASAVMSGLSSSPQPGWHANTFNSLSGGGGRVKAGARQQLYAGGAAAPAAGGVGVGGPAAREVFAQPLTSEGDCLDVVVAAPTSSSGSSTSRLIHQLASRAAEAQRLLQSLQ